jgi:glycogen(starch) synthase
MFGWEFPPHISGGLGTACYGITKGLARFGTEIVFVLPRSGEERDGAKALLISASHVPLESPTHSKPNISGLRFRPIVSNLVPYEGAGRKGTPLTIGRKAVEKPGRGTGDGPVGFGRDMVAEAARYGRVAGPIVKEETFDVIHGHDWMTVQAGLEARRLSGRPYIYHVHSLEFDRSGEQIDQRVCDIERRGLENADHVISVSRYTKDLIMERYGIDREKITVVHNAVEQGPDRLRPPSKIPGGRKIVLFLGRITFQKGPEYFIEAAAKVLAKVPETVFVMAGTGDLMPRMIEKVAGLRLGRHFHFTGFIEREKVERLYGMSDLYVMPSVSEPFGIAALEAMLHGVPVILSKQSGVSEVVKHALRVDFWDVHDMASKIIAVLTRPALVKEMTVRSREDMSNIHWDAAAEKVMGVYQRVCG